MISLAAKLVAMIVALFFAALFFPAIDARAVCQEGFYIDEAIDMFRNYTHLVSISMDCSQEQFPSLNVTVESQLIDEINDGDSENPKVALSLKCVDHMTNITSYHNGSYVVKKSDPWYTVLSVRTGTDLPFGQDCSVIGCFWDTYGPVGYQYQRRFAVEGSTCVTNPNECLDDPVICDQQCTDINTGYECSCVDGYRLDDDLHNCTDIDECSSGTNTCSHYCKNVGGGYSCYCPDGYKLDNDNKTCLDINECMSDNELCHHVCINTHGSYQCKCRDGYRFNANQTICIDIDECDLERCEQICNNTIGSYSCDCLSNYSLSSNHHTCLEYGECEHLKLCSHKCVNITGEYYCECNAGYTLNEDRHNCTIDGPQQKDDQLAIYMSWVIPLGFAFFLLILSVIISYTIVRRRKHGNILETNSDLYEFYLTQEKLDYNYEPVDLSHGLGFDSASLNSQITSFHSASNTEKDLAKLTSSEMAQIVLVSANPSFSGSKEILNAGHQEGSGEERDESGVQRSRDIMVLDCGSLKSNKLTSHNSHDSCVGSSIAGESSPDYHTSIIMLSSDVNDTSYGYTSTTTTTTTTTDTSANVDYIETGCISNQPSLSPKETTHTAASKSTIEAAEDKQQSYSMKTHRVGEDRPFEGDPSSTTSTTTAAGKCFVPKTKDYIHATNALFAVSDNTTQLNTSDL